VKDLYIDQLPSGDFVNLFAAVQQRELKTARNGNRFMTMTLADRTGTIEAVWFDLDGTEDEIKPGVIVCADGYLGEYQGKPQFSIEDCVIMLGEYDLSDYCPSTKHNIDDLWTALLNCVASIQDDHIRVWLEKVLADEEIAPRLRQWPAGMKLHHAYVGGLLEHIVSMTKVAWLLSNHYKRLNRGLLIASVIFHDLGKIEELSVGVTFGYTKTGSLHGHIVLGYSLIDRLCRKYVLDEELKLQLQHLVLSHHDLLEHGAAKRPMTAEAMALSVIDVLDARLEQFWRLTDAAGDDKFTAYIPSLERALYCGSKDNPTTTRELAASGDAQNGETHVAGLANRQSRGTTREIPATPAPGPTEVVGA
jgi:3'-5' exoribonuclease